MHFVWCGQESDVHVVHEELCTSRHQLHQLYKSSSLVPFFSGFTLSKSLSSRKFAVYTTKG